MKRVFNNGRYANVTATLALVLALGGTSYAAITLPANSVGTGQIRPLAVKNSDIGFSSVTTGKVKDGTLRSADFAPGQLPAPAPPAPAPIYAHVLATGALDLARTTPGIAMTHTHYGNGPWPVYCFSFTAPAQPPKNIMATPEDTTSVLSSGPAFLTVTLNATVDPAQAAIWGCPSGTDAAVLSQQPPESALYVLFQR